MIQRLGDGELDLVSGSSSGGLEGGKMMAGGEHGQFWPQRGEFSTNVGGEMMVRGRVIRAAEQCASRVLRGTGIHSCTKGFRDNPDGGPECAAGRPT